MYHRYKPKRKYKTLIKTIFTILLSVVLIVAVFLQRSRFMFWKQDVNKLQVKTAEAEKLIDYGQRVEFFRVMAENAERGKAQKPFDADIFLFSGKTYFLLGEAYLEDSFSELFSDHRLFPIDRRARDSFIAALRDINKGIALSSGSISAETRAIKAQIEYYLSYRPILEIASSVKAIALDNEFLPVELARFCAFAVVLGGDRELGIRYLNARGGIGEDLNSELYLAALEYHAKMYTSAIMRYRKILSETDNDNFKKTALLGLVQIYHDQSLDRELIEEAARTHEMFPDDSRVKMWVEKLRSFTNDKPALRNMFNNLIAQNESKIETEIPSE